MKILLTCASSTTRPLAGADAEIVAIATILQGARFAQNTCTNPNTTLENITSTFRENPKDIALFHYSGHANGKAIELWEDTSQKLNKNAYAEGLAKFIQSQNCVKFVFINGCSSKGQVTHFLQNGIRAVIATNRPIADDLAVTFAKHFYAAWVKPMVSLEKAFHEALGLIATEKSYDKWFDNKYFEPEEAGDSAQNPPYQLYTHINNQGNPFLDAQAPVLKASFHALINRYNPPLYPTQIFTCYHSSDEALVKELDAHFAALKRNGSLQWTAAHTLQFEQGETEDNQIKAYISDADIVLLMISPKFMNDEELWTSQLLPALERHQLGECIIIPVLATRISYSDTAFGSYMPLPRNKKFISEHPSKDTALYEIVEEIKKIIEPK